MLRYGTHSENERFKREYIELYDTVVRPAVINNDQSHIWLYSSPSNGIKSEKILNANPQDNKFGDSEYILKQHVYSLICFANRSICCMRMHHVYHYCSTFLRLYLG